MLYHSVHAGSRETPRIPQIQPTASTISDMQPGDIWWIVFTSMKVDQDNHCFLDPSAERHPPGGLNRIIVRRDIDGGYHVTIPDTYRFRPYQAIGWIPVASIRGHSSNGQKLHVKPCDRSRGVAAG